MYSVFIGNEDVRSSVAFLYPGCWLAFWYLCKVVMSYDYLKFSFSIWGELLELLMLHTYLVTFF